LTKYKLVFITWCAAAFVICLASILLSKQFSSLTNAHQLFSSQQYHSAEQEYQKLRRLGITDDQLYLNLSYILLRKEPATAVNMLNSDLQAGKISVADYLVYRWQLAKVSDNQRDIILLAQHFLTTNSAQVSVQHYIPQWLAFADDTVPLAKFIASQPERFKEVPNFGLISCIALGNNNFLGQEDSLREVCAKQPTAYSSKDRIDLITRLLGLGLTSLARTQSGKLIETNPDFYQAYVYTAISYIEIGDWGQADSFLQTAYKLAPEQSSVRYFYLLSLLHNQRDKELTDYIHNLPEDVFDLAQLEVIYTELLDQRAYGLINKLSSKHKVIQPITRLVSAVWQRKIVESECENLLIQINSFELGIAYAKLDRSCKPSGLGLLYERNFLPL
jgi:tetratricopeptide (TPR) repeat protein